MDAAGNSATKIAKNCGAWRGRIWRETTERNSSEYDAPVYYGTDFAPARMVAEFARDEKMRVPAEMTLHFRLAQTAGHWPRGYHISTAGRGKYWGSLMLGPDSAAPTNGMAYLLFGGDRVAHLASAPQCYCLAHPGRGWKDKYGCKRTAMRAATQPMSEATVQQAIKAAVLTARLKKTDVCCHALRHSYATHLLEEGVSVRQLQSYTSRRHHL